MIKKNIQTLFHCLLIVFMVMTPKMALSATSLACSATKAGAAVINEVQVTSGYVEIYLLQSTNIANWAIYNGNVIANKLGLGTCTVNGVTAPDNASGVTTYPAGTYIDCPVSSISPPNGEILLVDKTTALSAGDATVINYFNYGNPNTRYWQAASACEYYYGAHNANNKDMARLPDGTGNIVDNGSKSTPGYSNSGITLALSVDNPTSLFGENITYTLSLSNLTSAALSNLSVKDLLSAGLTYVSSTTLSGSYIPASGVWSIGSVNANSTVTLTLIATHAQVGALTNTATVYQGTVNLNVIASVVTTATVVPGVTPNAFNCVEAGAGTTGSLYTKLASTGFGMDVVALNADGSLDTQYVGTTNKTVTVELVDGSSGLSCANLNSIPSASQLLTFTGASAGRQTIAMSAINNAYSNVRCRVTDANQLPNIVSCSGDNFSIRPSSLVLSSNADNSLGGKVIAGNMFTLTANSGNNTYAGSPSIDATQVTAHGGAAQVGLLSGSFVGANGIATSDNATYSEVGLATLNNGTLIDKTYTLVDSALGDCTPDSSNLAISGKYGCYIGQANTVTLGRFTPSYFSIEAINHGVLQSMCSGAFTYIGQRFSLSTPFSWNAVARNSAGDVTKNYQDSYQFLSADAVAFNTPLTDSVTKNRANALFPVTLTPVATKGMTSLGETPFSVQADVEYSRDSLAQVAAFNSDLHPVFKVTDADGIQSSSVTLSPTSINLRYGRTTLINNYGSERQDLSVLSQVQYYTASGFSTNTADSCTTATVKLTADSLPVTASCVIDNTINSGAFSCNTPGTVSHYFSWPASQGNFNLNLMKTDVPGTLGVQLVSPAYLQYDWLHTGIDTDPTALASFGFHHESGKIVYWREIF